MTTTRKARAPRGRGVSVSTRVGIPDVPDGELAVDGREVRLTNLN